MGYLAVMAKAESQRVMVIKATLICVREVDVERERVVCRGVWRAEGIVSTKKIITRFGHLFFVVEEIKIIRGRISFIILLGRMPL